MKAESILIIAALLFLSCLATHDISTSNAYAAMLNKEVYCVKTKKAGRMCCTNKLGIKTIVEVK